MKNILFFFFSPAQEPARPFPLSSSRPRPSCPSLSLLLAYLAQPLSLLCLACSARLARVAQLSRGPPRLRPHALGSAPLGGPVCSALDPAPLCFGLRSHARRSLPFLSLPRWSHSTALPSPFSFFPAPLSFLCPPMAHAKTASHRAGAPTWKAPILPRSPSFYTAAPARL